MTDGSRLGAKCNVCDDVKEVEEGRKEGHLKKREYKMDGLKVYERDMRDEKRELELEIRKEKSEDVKVYKKDVRDRRREGQSGLTRVV